MFESTAEPRRTTPELSDWNEPDWVNSAQAAEAMQMTKIKIREGFIFSEARRMLGATRKGLSCLIVR